ncbi:hypothetical protein BGZ47_004344 [Haplosporangium gracile]|nr:hypothetical protein BGZ47_004344 [Haplosporangium gracile]
MEKCNEFQAEMAEAKEDSRLLQDSIVRIGTAIEHSIMEAAQDRKRMLDDRKLMLDDRKLMLDTMVEMKNTQAVMAQLLARMVEK